MTTCVVTGWHGEEFDAIAEHTVPLIAAYAKLHGHDFWAADLVGERPPSWLKIPRLREALERHDTVAWIDADVVIVNARHDLIASAPADSWQAMVRHHTAACGAVPNCGVWVLRRQMLPVLDRVWDDVEWLSHPWWEQAAVMRLMGYAISGIVARLDIPTTLYERTAFLPQAWNDHPHDQQQVASPYFVHVTQYTDRLGTVQRLAAAVKAGHRTSAV